MAKKTQPEVIKELQYNTDVVILNNPLSAPKLVRKLSKNHEIQLNEVYISKLFYDIISRITPEHLEMFEQGKDVVKLMINIGEFLNSISTGNSNNLYRHVIDCIDLLQTTQVKWKDKEGQKESGTSIITHYDYYPRQGKVEIVLYKEFVKQVVQVTQNEHFSFFKKYLYRLQKAQAIKLFPYFVSWRNQGMIEISLTAFRAKFGYNTEGYRFFNNLKLKVIDPAINEINEKTDLTITYKLVGENLEGARPRVTGFQFFIQEKKQKTALADGQQRQIVGEIRVGEILENIQPELDTDVLNKFYDLIADYWGVDKPIFIKTGLGKSAQNIQNAIDYTKEQVRAGKADRPAGVFIDALRNGYKTAEVLKKETTEQKNKATKEKAASENRVEVDEKEKQRQKQKDLFEQQRAIFDRLIKTDKTFWLDLEPQIRANNMMKNNYNFEKAIFENMQTPMIAGIVMGIAVKLRAVDFE